MHMKYFQSIADIKNHYDEIIERIESNDEFSEMLLDTWEISQNEKKILLEEREALRYLIGCQTSLVKISNAQKPSIEAANRCFNRQLRFLEKIHDCHAYNVNKHPNKIIQKKYKACRHYLFQFSLKAWYKKLPKEILTFENKYPDVNL